MPQNAQSTRLRHLQVSVSFRPSRLSHPCVPCLLRSYLKRPDELMGRGIQHGLGLGKVWGWTMTQRTKLWGRFGRFRTISGSRFSPGDPGYGPAPGYGAQTRRPQAGCWTASSFRMRSGCQCEPSAPGTGETIALSTGPSSAGWSLECWRATGLFWWRAAKNWPEWTGNGSRRTAPWARPVLGGRHWTQPHLTGAKLGARRAFLVRRGGRTPERGGGWSQRP